MKKTAITTVYFTIFFLSLSCNSNDNNKEIVYLKEIDKQLNFPLDSETKSSIWAFFPYTDSTGKEYLTFQNERRNEILFYDIEKECLLYKINPEMEGANGVGHFFGYYIEDLDNIYLTAMRRPVITHIDKNGQIKDKIEYGITSDSLTLGGSNSLSFRPCILIEKEMYIISQCNRMFDKNPVSATINMNNKKTKALPFEYPIFSVSKDKSKSFSIEMDFSRCYDGENFVYSFHYDEDIYITKPDHKLVNKVPIKSKYIPEVKFYETMASGNPMKCACENPKYGNLLYDKYRDVYYRVAYPEVELADNENYKELYAYGRKTFSIMILDKQFNIIGETLFPDYVYNPTLLFIRKDGLYISNSHIKNPNYNEDYLSFTKFEIKKIAN